MLDDKSGDPRAGELRRAKLASAQKKFNEYIDYQVKAFRFALFLLGTLLTNAEVRSLQDNNSFNFSRFGFIIVICTMLYFTVYLENKEGEKKQNRKKDQLRDSMVIDMQGEGFRYLLDELVHHTDDLKEKLSVIETVPRLLNLVSVEAIEKTMASGFQGLVETLSIFVNEFDKKGSEIKKQINDALEGVLLKKTPPRPNVNVSSLLTKEMKENDVPAISDEELNKIIGKD